MNSLKARLHWTDSQKPHLRAYQDFFVSDAFSEALKKVGSPYRWHGGQCEWDWPLTPAGVSTLMNTCARFGVAIEWSDELKTYAESQKQLDEYEEKVRLAIEQAKRDGIQLPGYPTNTFNSQKPPMRHQELAFHWSQRTTGLMLAWDPGTGKTRGATDAAGGWYRNGLVKPMEQVWIPEVRNGDGKVIHPARWATKGGILVVCPKPVIRTWSRELQQWQGMTSVEITGSASKTKYRKAGMAAHAHIINYESLKIVKRNEYHAIIVDESHRCANNSGQTQNVLDISLNCVRKLLLTGSPVSNSLESVYYQMLITDGGRALGPSHAAFLSEFFNEEISGPGIRKNVARANAATEVAKSMAKCCYFVNKEDIRDWPAKLHTPIYLDMTPDQERYYEQLKQDAITYIQDSQVTVDQASAKMMKLIQLCQGIIKDDEGRWREFNNIKMETTVDRLKNELYGRKVIIWCRFTHEITKLVERLHREGIWSLRFDGAVSHNNRNAIIEAWNTDPRYTAFVGQVSMGEGIELLADECELPCFETIYQGLDYRYVSWKQSQDRTHRITQKYDCNYTYLLTENGIDRSIYQALLAKESTANTVQKTGKDYFLSLLKGDIANLEAL